MDRQAVAPVAHGDLGHEAEMAGDELVRRVTVAVLLPPLGQHVFLVRLQHWKLPDVLKIALEARLTGGNCRQ